jgi:hypothetical protein
MSVNLDSVPWLCGGAHQERRARTVPLEARANAT